MSAPERRVALRDGLALVYWRWPGGAPPTLLLHGIANYGRYWDRFADAVAGALQLAAPDARGHGESARPAEGYTPADFAGDALVVLDDLGWETALVVGHSMGGRHATALATSAPDRVRALVLVDVGPEIMAEGAERATRLVRDRPARFADDAAALAYLRRTSPGYDDGVYAGRIAHAFRRAPDGALEWHSDRSALTQIRSGGTTFGWGELARITCPTLIVRGTRSNTLAASTVARMLETIHDARATLLEAGHNVPLERPRELAAAVIGFARGIAAASGSR